MQSIEVPNISASRARVKCAKRPADERERMTRDEYTEHEIRQAVWWATLGLDATMIARNLGRHSPDSVYLLLIGIAGQPDMHTSALSREVAEALDHEERFHGWREAILERRGTLLRD